MASLQKTESIQLVPSTLLACAFCFTETNRMHMFTACTSQQLAEKQTCSQHIVTIASALQAVRRIRSIFHAQAFLLAASWHNALHRCLSNHEEARPQRLQC